MYGARVSPSGVVLDPEGGFVIDAASGREAYPDVAWNGTTYFAVWSRDDAADEKDIYGARITPSGGVLDPTGIAVATGFERQTRPRLAWGASSYLVVWETFARIVGSRVSGGGQVLDREGINLGDEARGAALTWDGSRFLVTWSKWSNVLAARVTEAGEVLDERPYPIAFSGDDEYGPESVLGADGLVAVVYTRYATEREYGIVEREFIRFVETGSPAPQRTGYAISTQTGQSLVAGQTTSGTTARTASLRSGSPSRSGSSARPTTQRSSAPMVSSRSTRTCGVFPTPAPCHTRDTAARFSSTGTT